MDELKVLSFNVRGIRDPCKRNKVFSYLKKFRAHVILLQECHVLPEDYDLWKANWGKGQIFINPLSERSAGQMILLNDKYNVESHEILIKGRCQKLDMIYKDKQVSLINVYAPNIDKDQIDFYRNLQEKLYNKESTHCLLLGGGGL